MKIIPRPIVSWETVVRLSDPLHAPSRQRLRTLKASRTASGGVRVVSRRRGRASGSAVYYSALTALAAQAKHVGDEDTARRLSSEGSQIEATFRDLLQDFLSTQPLEALTNASFYPELVAATKRAVDLVWSHKSGDLIVGQIKIVREDLAEIDGTFQDHAARVDLPTALVDQIGSRAGDYVWVLRRLVGSAAVVTVLPAVASEPDEQLDDAYLTTGAGAPISAAESAYFAALGDDDLPEARILRLAG